MGSFHPTEPHVATIQPCLLPSLSSPICLPHPQSLFSSWNLGIKVLECEQEAADQKEEDKHASFSYRALQNKPPHNFFKKLFLLHFSIIIYPPHTLVHLPPPHARPPNRHTVVHVHKFLFIFAQSLHAPMSHPHPELSDGSLSLSLPFGLLVQFIRFHI